MLRLLPFLIALATPARACDIALLLAVDVSGSVDPREYTIQMEGLAAGLQNTEVAEALVASRARIALMQWTGTSRQEISLDWVQITDYADIAPLAETILTMPRAWRDYSTAIGEAMLLANSAFADVADCKRRVIDISGDGPSNEGIAPEAVRTRMIASGITVNALVIEASLPGLTDYYRRAVITGPGAFAITANTYADYPREMTRKLLREVTVPLTLLETLPRCDHMVQTCDHTTRF